MTLKTIVQNTLQRVGLPAPDFIMPSNDDGVRLVRGLVNQEGDELAQRHNWQSLTAEHQIVTRAQESQPDAIAPGFSHFINDSIINLSRNQPLESPVDAQDWQDCKAGGYSDACLYRVRGNNLLLMPTPSAGELIGYEYISKHWVHGGKAEMTADDDVSLLDENLITLGCIWRYLHAIGNDYGQAFDDYEKRVATAIARDGPVRNLDFRRRPARHRRRPMRPRLSVTIESPSN